MTMRAIPPIRRRTGSHSPSTPPAYAAVIPRIVKTVPNPSTYAAACRRATQRDGRPPSGVAATATAVS